MANQSYPQLLKQIAALEAQAEKAKKEEVAGVVMRIKEAIDSYGLTEQDLFAGKSGVVRTKAKRLAKGKASIAAKYVDGKGGQWVGRGKRPKWLSDALAAGRQLEDFLAEKFKSAVETFSSPPAEAVAPADVVRPKRPAKKLKPAAAAKKALSAEKYSDGAGNTWSGKGPTPKWLKDAIAGGKTREEFLVPS
jgi:DNA-binding protein H-NS